MKALAMPSKGQQIPQKLGQIVREARISYVTDITVCGRQPGPLSKR
jgi:hypothetical protein